jgi:hypothetical protein
MGTHRCTIRPNSFDHESITDSSRLESTRKESLWIARCWSEYISTLTVVPDYYIVSCVLSWSLWDHHYRMLRSIESGTSHFCHTGINFDKMIPVVPRIYDIHDLRDEGGTIGCEIGPRLDLEMQLATRLFIERIEQSLHMIPDLLEICRLLILHPSYLESSTQRYDLYIREFFDDGEYHRCYFFPYFRI